MKKFTLFVLGVAVFVAVVFLAAPVLAGAAITGTALFKGIKSGRLHDRHPHLVARRSILSPLSPRHFGVFSHFDPKSPAAFGHHPDRGWRCVCARQRRFGQSTSGGCRAQRSGVHSQTLRSS